MRSVFALIEGGDGDKGEGSFLECEGSETLEGTKTKRSNRPRQTSMRAALRRALAAMRFAVGVELLIVAAWSMLIGAATCGLSRPEMPRRLNTCVLTPTLHVDASVVVPTRAGRILHKPVVVHLAGGAYGHDMIVLRPARAAVGRDASALVEGCRVK